MSASKHPLQRMLEVFPDPMGLGQWLLPGDWGKQDHEGVDSEEITQSDPVAPIGQTRATALMVERAFGFLDLADFTSTVERLTPEETTALLSAFRTLVREVAAARGCRISRWVGDGVLLVSVDDAALVATMVELVHRLNQAEIPSYAGIASGEVLLFEGDDHIGSAVNLASRLSDAARPGQVLAADSVLAALPAWVGTKEKVQVKIKGMGKMKVTPLIVQE